MIYLNSDRVHESLEGDESLTSLMVNLGHKDLNITLQPLYRINKSCERFLINHLGLEPLAIEPEIKEVVEIEEEPELPPQMETVDTTVTPEAEMIIKNYYRVQYIKELSTLKYNMSEGLVGWKALKLLVDDMMLLVNDMYSFVNAEYGIDLSVTTFSNYKNEVKEEMAPQYSHVKADTVSVTSVNMLIKPFLVEVANTLLNRMKGSTFDCSEFYKELQDIIESCSIQ